MELTNDFRVGLPVERAWDVLTDVERTAPCMPGAQLQEVDGDEYRGIVKVKVGPITAQYKGTATFLERDEAGRRIVLRAEGRETRGQGNANATITATLRSEGDGGTAVAVVTDLTVTGKVAQFGRGVLADVSAKLLGEFVRCLESTVLSGEPATTTDEHAVPDEPAPTDAPPEAADAEPSVAQEEASPVDAPVTAPPEVAEPEAPAATPGPPSGPRKVDMPEPKPVDLLEAAGTPVAKRVGPVVALVALAWLLRVLLRRRRG